MKELNARARALLSATELADDPSDADFDRVHAAVVARLAVGVAVGATVTAGAKTAVAAASTAGAAASTAVGASVVAAPVVATASAGVTAGLASSLPVVKVLAWVVAASMTAGVGTAVVVSRSRSVDPSHEVASAELPAPVTRPSPLPVAASTRRGDLQPAVPLPPTVEIPPTASLPANPMADLNAPPASAPSTTSQPAMPRPSSVAPSSSASLAIEISLIRDARGVLNAGDPERALALLDSHAQRFPDGAMAEERDELQVFATCKTGQGDAARELATLFLAKHPGSPYAAAVKASCPAGSPASK